MSPKRFRIIFFPFANPNAHLSFLVLNLCFLKHYLPNFIRHICLLAKPCCLPLTTLLHSSVAFGSSYNLQGFKCNVTTQSDLMSGRQFTGQGYLLRMRYTNVKLHRSRLEKVAGPLTKLGRKRIVKMNALLKWIKKGDF
jgi:hypothetical protein